MFLKAVNIVLEREGVLSDNPRDNGGLTKYGISQRAHPNVDVASLTKAEAIEIYKEEYWNACSCGEFPWWAALLTFDAAVQHGQHPARMLLQRTVGARPDGVIGPITKKLVSSADRDEAVGSFQALRFMRIYLGHEDWDENGKGWLRRSHILAYYCAT